MIFLLLIFQIAYTQTIEELQQRVDDLLITNNFLHHQLVSCSLSSSILEDLNYNKEKLQNLIVKYYESSDKLHIAEEIKYYLHAISSDLRTLGPNSDEVSYENVEIIVGELNKHILKAKILQENYDFAKAYNKLKDELEESSEKNSALVIENARLLAKYEATKVELKNLYTLYNGLNDSNQLLTDELEEIKSQHEERIEIIENSLTSEQQLSRTAEINNFKIIQESQNSLIVSLQQQNNDETLVVEQQNTDISLLENKLLIQETTISRLVKIYLATRIEF